ncbi:MAG: MarC family protein [Halothiobacillaceae bacterium]|nr:MarC family protein [Halothiobacillaceae bacterium]
MNLEHDLTIAIALLAIMNPLSAVPLFLALTSNDDAASRRAIALQSGLATLLTLIVAYFIGDLILQVFSIHMDGFRIAGSLIIAASAWAMVFGRASKSYGDSEGNPAVIPLAIPKTAGPGTIALVVSMGKVDGIGARVEDTVIILLACLIFTAVLLTAERIQKVLGDIGMGILTRILGLLLLAAAVSSILNAAADFFPAWTAVPQPR